MEHDDNVDKLLDAVSQNAAFDRDKVMADAQAQVRRIEAQTQDQMVQIQRQIQVEAERAIHLERDHLKGQSQMAFRLAHQTARVRLLEMAYAEAQKKVAALPQSATYQDILGALMAEALVIVGPDSVIKVAPSDETLCRAWIKQQTWGCTLEVIQAEPGTVLASAVDGDRRVDNSLTTRLARARSLCQHEVAAVLFQDDTESRGCL